MQKTYRLVLLAIIIIALLVFSFFEFVSFSTKPESENGSLRVKWQQFLPGITGKKIIETSDNGFLVLGTTATVQQESSTEHIFVNEQPILIKTDSSGTIIWQKTFQVEELTPTLNNMIQTVDGGYAVIGGITSPNQIVPQTPYSRFVLIKLDSQGNVNWTQTYVGPSLSTNNAFNTVFQTDDGNYVLFGNWNIASDYHGFAHGFLVKTDEAGNRFFNTTVSVGAASSMVPVSNGYVFFSTRQASGGGDKFMLVKTDLNGETLWVKDYQGIATSAYETCGTPTSDGGYLIGGSLVSPDKGWLVKTDAQGSMVWNKTYGETTTINSVAQTQDGGFVISGDITYINPENNGESAGSAWIAKTDGLGDVETQVKIGQNATFHYTHPSSVLQTVDGSYICVGTWDQTYEASSAQRFWLAKLYAE